MMNDHNPVAGGVHIQFDRIGSTRECLRKGGDCVFRELGSGAAVGDSFDGHCSSR